MPAERSSDCFASFIDAITIHMQAQVNKPMQTKLFVRNLSNHTTESYLQKLFEEFGEVRSAMIATDKYSGKSRGFGFIQMKSSGEARSAVESLNKKKVHGRVLHVAFSESQEKKRSTAYSYLY
jgi:RNA recognition motif-containing protein